MATTKYTSWISTTYKKKTYYLRGWITYTLSETPNRQFITYTAGLETKTRAYNSTAKLGVTVTDTFGKKKTGSQQFKGGTNKTKKITFISSTKWEWDKKPDVQKIEVKLAVNFGASAFSGKKLSPKVIDITIGAKSNPSVKLVAERATDTSETVNLSLSINTDRMLYVQTPTVKKNGGNLTLDWGVEFPYHITTTGITTLTATDTVDVTHGANYEYSGVVGEFTHTDSSSIEEVYPAKWQVKTTDPHYSPTAEEEPAIVVQGDLPDVNNLNNALIKVYAYDYRKGIWALLPNDGGWQIEAIDSTHWKIPIRFDERYVSDPTASSATAKIRIQYVTYQNSTLTDNLAIFSTNRNANFSTGLANNIFIGGCTLTDYSSRVWYSAVNNPLYIPDINYIEVGSNDTRVMGLVKVGDYLGVIKQSKSIDSSVFLVYPTSFDDETTFATKPCVSGVGALGQYCFNVLGDETLFLSPRGIMAIEPSEEEASRVKDRSYYVNGRLLEEPYLENAYSFVWNGYYMLAVNNHVYVLDGNQRNSWGNQKTNLVYECYYLENVPAKILFSYDGELWFADFNGNLCRFKKESDENPYMDEDEPVVARWATIADDDNAVHYLKRLEKKGTVVSLLPENGTTARVYINKDDAIGKDNGVAPIVESDPIPEGTILPPSVYPKKKIKKYKRLQFVIEDITAHPFGINKIIKSYTLQNYAKK